MKRQIVPFIFIMLFAYVGKTQVNCSVNAGVNARFCQGETMPLLGGTSGTPIAGTERWRQISGPTTTIADTTAKVTSAVAVSPGIYVFRFSSDCDLGSNFQDVTYTVDSVVSTVQAGIAQTTNCYTGGSILLDATNRTAPGSQFTGSWQQTSGPRGTISFSGGDYYFTPDYGNLSSYDCDGECGDTLQDFTFAYSLTNVDNSQCRSTSPSATDKELRINYGDVPFLAGPANDVCVTTPGCDNPSDPYRAWGRCPGSGAGLWTITPSAGITISDSSSRFITISGVVPGQSYKLVWEVTGRTCGIDGKDSITFTGSYASAVTNATATSAVRDFCTNIPNTLTLEGNNFGVGESVLWTQISGAPVTINSPNSANTTASGFSATGGPYVFRYTISNVACSDFGEVEITVNNSAPTLNLTDQSTCVRYNSLGSTFLTPNFALPTEGSRYQSYDNPVGEANGPNADVKLISYPSGVRLNTTFAEYYFRYYGTFGSRIGRIEAWIANTNNSGFFGRTEAGAYVYEVTAYNSCGSTTDQFAHIVGLQGAPLVNAGTDQILPCNDTFTQLAGNVVPMPHWDYVGSVPSGAPTPIFTSTQDTAYPDIAGLQAGYVYVYSYSSGYGDLCTKSSDDMNVVVSSSNPPAAVISSPTNGCGGSEIDLEANLPQGMSGQWNILSGPAGLTVNDPNSPNTYLTGTDTSETYQIEWVITNGCGSSRDTITINTSSFFGPTKAIAGEDVCTTISNVPLNASPLAPNTRGVWRVIDRPPNSSDIDLTDTTSESTFLAQGQGSGGATRKWGGFTLTWTTQDTLGLCPASVDTVQVGWRTATVIAENIIRCNETGLPLNLDLNSYKRLYSTTSFYEYSDQPVVEQYWKLSSGTGVTLPTNVEPDTITAQFSDYGEHSFTRVVQIGGCVQEDVSKVIIKPPSSIANAGTDTTLCNTISGLNLMADSISSGYGFWSIDSGAGGSFSPLEESQKHNGNFIPNPGVTRLKWTSTQGGACISESGYDFAYVTYNESANAGTDISLCEANAISLLGSNPQPGYGIWSKVSGPGSQPRLPSDSLYDVLPVAVDGLNAGTYEFEYKVESAACGIKLDTIEVTIDSLTTDPNAGVNDTTCLADGSSYPISLNGNTPPAGYTATWTKELGSGPTYSASGTTGSYTANDTGSYVFSYEFSNGVCAIKDYVDYILLDGSPEDTMRFTYLRICNDSFQVEVDSPSTLGKYRYVWSFENATPSDTSGIDLVAPGIVVFNSIGTHEVKVYMEGPNLQCKTGDSVDLTINCLVFPVEYTYFEVKKMNEERALLEWQTASEENNSHFEIQRMTSENGTYVQVGLVEGQGNSSELTDYFAWDDISNLAPGPIYYRLKQVDFDGTFEYSEERVIYKEGAGHISVSPNPTKGDIHIWISDSYLDFANGLSVELIDVSGKVIKTVRSLDNNDITLKDLNLAEGVYLIRLTRNGYTLRTHRIVVAN
jgi:hypothetical protein